MKLVDDTLRVHTTTAGIWFQTTGPEPVFFAGSPEQFVEDSMTRGYARIRLIGARDNARLITLLYEAKQAKRIHSVEVCTPAIVEKRTDRGRPGPVLFELGLCSSGPSQGGFHEVVDTDYRAYKLAVDPSEENLCQHPAWKALSFIQPARDAVATLLAHILDPRWFVDVCYPDRSTKFQMALGLDPYTQKGSTFDTPRCRICRRVLGCWKAPHKEDEVKKLFELAGTKCIPDSDKLGLRPHDFCWRVWGKYPDPVIANLRGSQRFAEFLRQTWLDAIYKGAASTPEERAGLFRPADFFTLDEEIYAYEQHAAKA
jgi:hypothetical protein